MNNGDAKARLPRAECLITFIPESEGGRSHPPPSLSGDVWESVLKNNVL